MDNIICMATERLTLRTLQCNKLTITSRQKQILSFICMIEVPT
jgi:hypothetical protein